MLINKAISMFPLGQEMVFLGQRFAGIFPFYLLCAALTSFGRRSFIHYLLARLLQKDLDYPI